PGAHDHWHLVHLDQLARCAHGGFGIGLIILNDSFDPASEHATCPVDLLDHRLHGLEHAWTVRSTRPRQWREDAEFQGLALGAGAAGHRGGNRHGGGPLYNVAAPGPGHVPALPPTTLRTHP